MNSWYWTHVTESTAAVSCSKDVKGQLDQDTWRALLMSAGLQGRYRKTPATAMSQALLLMPIPIVI